MIPRTFGRNGWTWQHAAGAVALTALGAAVTSAAWADIWRIAAKDEESSHIFLVPLIAAWLIWVRRARLRGCQPHGMGLGLAALALGGVMHSLGDTYLIQSFWHGGAVLVVVGALLAVAGADVLRCFLPAFAVLAFLVPMPGLVRQQVALPLQSATASLTAAVLDLLGTPVTQSGNVLTLNGVDVAIAEACNGLRMVFALVLVCYAFAFGTPLRGYVRALIVAASPLTAIACNVVRLVPTVWAYGHHPGTVAESFHTFGGWVMLPLAFLLLLAIIRILRWALLPVTPYVLAASN